MASPFLRVARSAPALLAGLFLLGALFAQDDAKPQEPERADFRGKVVRAGDGAPLGGVTISLIGPNGKLSAETDATCAFSFSQVPAGSHLFSATLEGHFVIGGSVHRVEVSGTKPNPRIVEMQRGAIVEGSVEDPDGNAVPNVSVELLQDLTQSGERAVAPNAMPARTGPDGRFSFPGVAPGTYYLLAVGKSRFARDKTRPELAKFGNTFYPSSSSFEGAAPVSVYAGSPVSGIRIRLRPSSFHTVGGIVEGLDRNVLRPEKVILREVNGGGAGVYSLSSPPLESRIAPDGTFSIPRVPPGFYRAHLPTARLAFPVGSSALTVPERDLEGVRLAVSPRGVFSGRVVFEDGTYSGGSRQFLIQGANAVASKIDVSGHGAFAVEGLPAGVYRLGFFPKGSVIIRKIEWADGKSQGGAFEFHPPGGSSFVITISEKGATIAGRIDRDDSRSGLRAEGLVTLAPAPMTSPLDSGAFHSASVEPDGTFHITGIEPGGYRVCAWRETDHRPNAIMLSSAGQQRLGRECPEVRLKGDVQVQLQLKPISAVSLQ